MSARPSLVHRVRALLRSDHERRHAAIDERAVQARLYPPATQIEIAPASCPLELSDVARAAPPSAAPHSPGRQAPGTAPVTGRRVPGTASENATRSQVLRPEGARAEREFASHESTG